jgi:hypothetical protein
MSRAIKLVTDENRAAILGIIFYLCSNSPDCDHVTTWPSAQIWILVADVVRGIYQSPVNPRTLVDQHVMNQDFMAFLNQNLKLWQLMTYICTKLKHGSQWKREIVFRQVTRHYFDHMVFASKF